MKNRSIITLLIAASVIQVAHAEQIDENRPQTKLEEIESMLDLGCDNDNQCKSIGIGHSPCGGYTQYLVYSDKSTKVQQLMPLVEQYNLEQKQQNESSGRVGICIHISAPKAVCSANQCVKSEGAIQ